MNLLHWLPLFILGSLSESTTQLCLKKGVNANIEFAGLRYYLELLKNRWIICGISVFLIDMVVWLVLLAHIPLSIAFPMTGLQKIFIIFFTAFILKEQVDRIEWLAIALIAIGLLVIIQNTQGA